MADFRRKAPRAPADGLVCNSTSHTWALPFGHFRAGQPLASFQRLQTSTSEGSLVPVAGLTLMAVEAELLGTSPLTSGLRAPASRKSFASAHNSASSFQAWSKARPQGMLSLRQRSIAVARIFSSVSTMYCTTESSGLCEVTKQGDRRMARPFLLSPMHNAQHPTNQKKRRAPQWHALNLEVFLINSCEAMFGRAVSRMCFVHEQTGGWENFAFTMKWLRKMKQKK